MPLRNHDEDDNNDDDDATGLLKAPMTLSVVPATTMDGAIFRSRAC